MPNKTFNLNDHVRVKVTPEGEKIWNTYWAGKLPLKRDRHGYTEMQFHSLAHIFGSELWNGNSKLPIEPTIKLGKPLV